MKYLIIIMILSVSVIAQPRGDMRHDFSKRFQELEKIKLLEILDMDEETAIKFFSRRKDMRNNTRSLMEEEKKIHSEMEDIIGQSDNSQKLQGLIDELMNIEEKVYNERRKYLDSVGKILNIEQIAKLILFEKKFRNDVRDLLIERGRKKFFRKKDNMRDN